VIGTVRRAALFALGLALSLGFLYLSFRDVRFGDLRVALAGIAVPVLLLSPPVRLSTFLIAAVRTRVLLAPLAKMGTIRLFKSVLLAFAVNNVVPLRAGELARVGYLAQFGDLPASSCLAVIAVERLLDLVAILIIVIATLPFTASSVPVGSSLVVAAVVVGAAVVGVVLVSRHPQWFVALCRALARPGGQWLLSFVDRRTATFAEGLAALQSPAAVVAVMALTLLFWLLVLVIVAIWLWALGILLPWYTPVVVLAFLSFGLALPSTPGHIGTYHFFASAALLAVGATEPEAASFAVLGHALSVVPFTLLALPLLLGDYAQLRHRPAAPAPP
jgi:glycosyltransferase 2 family protein